MISSPIRQLARSRAWFAAAIVGAVGLAAVAVLALTGHSMEAGKLAVILFLVPSGALLAVAAAVRARDGTWRHRVGALWYVAVLLWVVPLVLWVPFWPARWDEMPLYLAMPFAVGIVFTVIGGVGASAWTLVRAWRQRDYEKASEMAILLILVVVFAALTVTGQLR